MLLYAGAEAEMWTLGVDQGRAYLTGFLVSRKSLRE